MLRTLSRFVLIPGLLLAGLTEPGPAFATGSVRGMDVSSWQGNVNWPAAWSNGARFAYVKATEGTGYRNPYFTQQYDGSYRVGMIRGAYHFARPDVSGGARQANYFVNHGGGWSADGKTLPPMLDIEYNPYGGTCYGLSDSSMVSWIRAFTRRVHYRTGRHAVIYSTTDWWKRCTGNYAGFADKNPLFIARYSSSAGTLPAGWEYYTFWQYSDHGTFPGDQDVFNGSYTRLRVLARGR
jgi:GH25 family lysozyme M1 (1,4-beta-N-acetylmuramidase)